jgi:hypothetical protein
LVGTLCEQDRLLICVHIGIEDRNTAPHIDNPFD